MVESIRYTKKLPDIEYINYMLSLEKCNKGFKQLVTSFSDYGNLDFIVLKGKNKSNPNYEEDIKKNWHYLIMQNAIKANFICNAKNTLPNTVEEITQKTIFESQNTKYMVPSSTISILNAFPLFIYEYKKDMRGEIHWVYIESLKDKKRLDKIFLYLSLI